MHYEAGGPWLVDPGHNSTPRPTPPPPISPTPPYHHSPLYQAHSHSHPLGSCPWEPCLLSHSLLKSSICLNFPIEELWWTNGGWHNGQAAWHLSGVFCRLLMLTLWPVSCLCQVSSHLESNPIRAIAVKAKYGHVA